MKTIEYENYSPDMPRLCIVSEGFLFFRPRLWLVMPYENQPGMSYQVGEFRDWRMANLALERLTNTVLHLRSLANTVHEPQARQKTPDEISQ